MTPEQLATKLRFAGKAVHSMTRRREGHDYLGRRMYLITMTVEGRRPLLGAVVGNPNVGHGAPEAPRMELSQLGKAVEKCWMEISEHYPQVEVLALQLMPDHLHGIIFVKEKMPQHLGHVIKVLKLQQTGSIGRFALLRYYRSLLYQTASRECCGALVTPMEYLTAVDSLTTG